MLNFIFIILISVLSLSFFTVAGFSFSSGRPVRHLLLNSLTGIAIMLIINLTSQYTHTFIPINQYTFSGAVLFGIPSTVFYLLLNFIF